MVVCPLVATSTTASAPVAVRGARASPSHAPAAAPRISQNLDLFSWTLSDEDMAALSAATVPAVAGAKGPSGEAVSGDCSIP